MVFRTEEFVCSVMYCESWDLEWETTGVEEIVEVLLPGKI